MIIEFWTQNLNPITCYSSTRSLEKIEPVVVKKPTLNERINKERKAASNARAITIEDEYGQKLPFETVIKAAEFLKIKTEKLYAIVNNREKNKTKYKIYKS